jgi:hypothetical protein
VEAVEQATERQHYEGMVALYPSHSTQLGSV